MDAATDQSLTGLIFLKDGQGRPVKPRRVRGWHDYLLLTGQARIRLPVGNYSFELDCGLEYAPRKGQFSMQPGARDRRVLSMRRIANLAEEGWFAGDIDFRHRERDALTLMKAAGLHIACLTLSASSRATDATVRSEEHRYWQTNVVTDEDTSLLAIGLADEPLDASSLSTFADWRMLKKGGKARIIAGAPDHEHFPIWLAHGLLDAVQVANASLTRDSAKPAQTGTRPRDEQLYPGPHGHGRWLHDIFFHALNCGLALPPVAGSGAGKSLNPPGYHRVYAQLEGECEWDKWWRSVEAGRTVVTNGPLLRPLAEGFGPGHTFQGIPGETLRIQVSLDLATRDKIAYIDFIQNGSVVRSVRLDDEATENTLPELEFSAGGWFLVRVVAEVEETYRFAMSAPFFVDFGQGLPVRRKSVEFFRQALDDLAARELDSSKDGGMRGASQVSREEWQAAMDFWNARW